MRKLLLLLLLPFLPVPKAEASTTLPARPANAPTGSQFAASLRGMTPEQRETAVLKELMRGNVPDFLRHLTPVKVRSRDATGHTHTATLHVMPDYLAIGTDQDFVRIPMTPDTA